jgi:hypothetical protein
MHDMADVIDLMGHIAFLPQHRGYAAKDCVNEGVNRRWHC